MKQEKVYYTWEQFDEDFIKILPRIRKWKPKGIYGIPKGGLILAVRLANVLNQPLLPEPKLGCLIVDDISDTGETLINIPNVTKYKTVTLFVKQGTVFMPNFFCRVCRRDQWVVYPWER